jgi:hypothetical protein
VRHSCDLAQVPPVGVLDGRERFCAGWLVGGHLNNFIYHLDCRGMGQEQAAQMDLEVQGNKNR